MTEVGTQIDTVMQEKRLFPPPKEFAAKARINARSDYPGEQALFLSQPGENALTSYLSGSEACEAIREPQ